MPLSNSKLLHSYLRLHHVFPEDLHIARPLIQMLQQSDRIKEARAFALSMARKMLANGMSGFALSFLAICKQLDHPNLEEIDALSNMAKITHDDELDPDKSNAKLFTLIEQLSDSEALDFIGQANLIKVHAGDNIVTQGETSETFFLILEGDVEVHVELADGSSKLLNTLVPGQFFGEFACVYKLKRTATVSAKSDAILLEFSGHSIEQLIERFPLAGNYLIQMVQTRMVDAITHSLPAFSDMPEEDKLWVVEESEVCEYETGTSISASELPSSACHIILCGEAEMLTADGSVYPLSAGSMMGAISPYIEPPADAVINVKQSMLICRIPEGLFRTFMNLYRSFEQQVKREGEKRPSAMAA